MKPPNSVSAQNARIANEIRTLTISFRNRSVHFPPAFYRYLTAKGINPATSVLVDVSTDTQGVNPLFGLICCTSRRFFEFDLDFDGDGELLVEELEWIDVTAQQNKSPHNKGYGKSRSYLALVILEELSDNRIS